MDIVSYILSTTFTKKSLEGMGALKGASCTISSIVDNPDGTHDITFSWKDNSDVTHTSILTVANGETPTIKSTEIEGGHTITFTTTDPSQSVSFNVMDGLEGQRGVSVIRANVDNNNYLTLELSDGNIINAGQIKTVSMVDNTLSLESANPVENRVITSALNNKVNKVSGKQLSTEDFTTAEKNKLANIENGAQVNTLENLIINGEEATIVDKKIALNIITSAVSNLQNYYLKSETYTKTEVEELIGSTVGVTIEIVQELPTVGQTNVIYFLPTETANVYSQYIYTSADGWVLIGSTSVDLSNYYTKGQVDTLLNGKQNVLTIDAFPTAMSNNPVASGGVYSAIAQMQPQFQFTNMPTASESNYGFVYQYIGNAGTYEPNMFYRCVYNSYAGEYRWEEVIFHSTITVDSELSLTSTNPVQNKVITEALSAKQDVMQFSTMPSAQDNLGKIVQYTGATTATYQNACFYKAVYDSEHDTYVWIMVKFSADISVDNVLSDVSENPVQNKVITKKFDEYETSFTGTQDEWNSLTTEEQNTYDIYHIIDDGNVLNLGVYLEKKTAMPVASEDVENKIYLYTGTTTQNYKKGVVYQCVSDGEVVPTYSWVALIDFGTASTKNSTDRVSPNNTDLVESQSVYSAINTALSSIYTPRGDITCAELTSALLISDNIGNVYETSDSGITTALFLQGAGRPIAVGSNVGIINAGQDRILFNLMANAFDLTSYQKKDLTQAVEGQTTVEGALGALSTNKQAKTLTTSVESQTTVEGALGALSTNKATQAEVNDIVNVLGAKNLLPFNFGHIKKVNGGGTWNGNVYTYRDITYTVNADGTITVDGTASADSIFRVLDSASLDFALNSGKTYYYTGSPTTGSSASTYYSYYSELVGGTWTYFMSYGASDTSVTPNASATQIVVDIFVKSGKTINNQVFKPMIRLASIPDNTYVPYAMTNQQITPYVQAISNPNLLDNPWFTVNQRGESSYSSDWVYTVDRWLKGESYTLSVGNNGISASVINIDHGHLSQRLDIYNNLVGKTCTLSILKSTGEISSATGVVLSGTGTSIAISDNDIWCALVKDANFDFIALNFKNTTTTVRAVKLELGTVSTLAMDTAPNYATELLKCQRYFQRIKGDSTNKVRLLFGLVSTTTTIQVQLPFAVPMRISNATITYSTNGILYGKTSTTTTVASDISLDPSSSICRNCLVIGTGLTVGETMPIYLDVGAYIDLSADL